MIAPTFGVSVPAGDVMAETILDQIVETKRKEIELAKQQRPLDELTRLIETLDCPRNFFGAVRSGGGDDVRLVAEIKKASPSAGLIVPDFDAVAIALTYAAHGAAALSVVTDETYFQGNLGLIRQVRAAVDLPVLRKDFLVEAYQVYEARAAQADAVLLIAEVVPPDNLSELASLATNLGMSVLVEVHSEDRLADVLSVLGSPDDSGYLVGINNRDLSAQRTDLTTMSRVARLLPTTTRFVAESGLAARADVLTAAASGACAVLVGESLLRSENLGAKVDELMGR